MALAGSERKSKTALGVLMFTSIAGTETDPVVRVDDPIGPKLIMWTDGAHVMGKLPKVHPMIRRAVERSDPGAYGYMTARLKQMDAIVSREVSTGTRQLVILGAG